MKETNYINNLENTIANLKKELDNLINEEKLAEEELIKQKNTRGAYLNYFEKIEKYCIINNIDLNTIMTNECIEYVLKDNYYNNIPENNFKNFINIKIFDNTFTYKKVLDIYKCLFYSLRNNDENDKTYNLDEHQTKINFLEKELHYANVILKNENTLKNLKKINFIYFLQSIILLIFAINQLIFNN